MIGVQNIFSLGSDSNQPPGPRTPVPVLGAFDVDTASEELALAPLAKTCETSTNTQLLRSAMAGGFCRLKNVAVTCPGMGGYDLTT